MSAAVVTVLGAGLFLAGGLGLAPWPTSQEDPAAARATGAEGSAPETDPLSRDIAALQTRLRRTPRDAEALGALGLDYVQRAKTSGDPTYYPKAEAVLKRSLALDEADNYTAMGGMAALEAARHNFTPALEWARKAIDVNPFNSTLYGTLADACTQLGRYTEAADAVQKMVDLKPGTPSLARASYSAELRGDTRTALAEMRRALTSAGSADERSFARHHISEITLNDGRPADALAQADAGLRAAPSDAPLLQMRARAQAALGRSEDAVTNLAEAAERLPLPEYVLQLGELHESLGHRQKAAQQYRIFRAEQKLFADNGVTLDTDAVLFEADHGNPERALTIARQALADRPFLDSHDALAWALHLNGQHRAALAESDRSLALGTRNALFHYHRAMIEKALGNRSAARSGLTRALAINPHFHPLHAPRARQALIALKNGTASQETRGHQ
ncbi:tetratricopeptide repeat protein [Streptomyces sp. NPDC054784]